MPINPNIPLQARAPNIGDIALDFQKRRMQMEDRERRNKLVDLKTKQTEAQIAEHEANAPTRALKQMSERDLARAKSLVTGAVQVQPLLQAGDVEGARDWALRRRQSLADAGIDTGDTEEFLQLLSNDPQTALQSVNQTVQFGQQLGFLKPVEQFEPVVDEQGNIVGQKNLVTGQVVKDPRAAPKPSSIPSGVSEFEFWKKLPPNEQSEYLRVKRASKFLDVGSGYVTPDPAQPTQTSPVAERDLKPAERPEHVADVKRAEKGAEAEAAKQQAFPKARDTLNSLERQWDVVESTIDTALNQVSPFTASVGAWTRAIPGSKARDLEENLNTIKANVGFDKLQDMRENSPTGGALGQVSELENRLLQAVAGSLEQGQSVEQLKKNLNQVKRLIQELREAKRKAFENDFKEQIQKQRTQEFDRGVDDLLGRKKRIKVDTQGNVID